MRNLICLCIVIAVSAGSGCSGEPGLKGLVPVTGTVTYQGKPVEGASVSFSPNGAGRSASAMTGEDGTFVLTTVEGGDGAMSGSFGVEISKSEVINPMSPEEVQQYFHEHMGQMPHIEYRHLLPQKYGNANTSGFTATVDASLENDFTFDLAD